MEHDPSQCSPHTPTPPPPRTRPYHWGGAGKARCLTIYYIQKHAFYACMHGWMYVCMCHCKQICSCLHENADVDAKVSVHACVQLEFPSCLSISLSLSPSLCQTVTGAAAGEHPAKATAAFRFRRAMHRECSTSGWCVPASRWSHGPDLVTQGLKHEEERLRRESAQVLALPLRAWTSSGVLLPESSFAHAFTSSTRGLCRRFKTCSIVNWGRHVPCPTTWVQSSTFGRLK